MPGIAGIIGQRPFEAEGASVLKTMVQCLRHESFDIVATAKDEQVSLRFGWALHEGSPQQREVTWNPRRDIGLFILGDTSTLGGTPEDFVGAYEREGLRFLEKLNASFSGVLLDLRDRKVTLFNDRYGLSRIYVHESKEGVFFSSEAKSILAVKPDTREVSQEALAEFFSVGCVLQNRSLFKGISLMPGGAMWTFQADGGQKRQRFFEPGQWEAQQPLDAESYCEQLTEIFARVLPQYLQGPENVALSLTGGLDSRMLLSWSGAPPGGLPCYTFAGSYRDCADVRIARRLAEICGQSHRTIPVGAEFLAEFPALAERTVLISDGTMDVSGAVELYVNRIARNIAPVRLTGNYGSEILRSNVAFGPGRINRSLLTPEFCRLIDGANETYRTEAAVNRLSFIAFKQLAWHHYARLSIERSQLTPRSPFLDNELVALAYRVPKELATSATPVLRMIARGNGGLEPVATDRALQLRGPSVASRISHAWQEFTAKTEYAYDYGMPRRLAKADHLVARLHLERLFLGRHKFYHFRIWYKNALRRYLTGVVATKEPKSACFRAGSAAKIVAEHCSGAENHTTMLHKLITLQHLDTLVAQGR